jgi:hypothetical protein
MVKNSRDKIYIPRLLDGKLRKFLSAPEVIAIVGARQVGKTTLMKRLYEDLPGPKGFLDFEDPELVALFEEDIKAFAQLYVKAKRYLFIDEFQHTRQGGKLLKYLYDNSNTKFIISGSSSLDLTVRAAYLVGRIFVFELFPLSFAEFLSYKSPELLPILKERISGGNLISNPLHVRLSACFEEFSVWGGYPRVAIAQDEEEKTEVLKNILVTYLLKDIRGFFRLASESSLQKLIKALALQIGSLIKYSELSQISDLRYTVLKEHLSILEETYILKLVRPFFTNKRLEITKNPKVYFVDTGLRNYLSQDFRGWKHRTDIGYLIENVVATELMKREVPLNFWRTKSKGEVDFIVPAHDHVIPLEVKSGVVKSVGKSFLSFIKKYRPVKGYILHAGLPQERIFNGTNVQFVPLYGLFALDLKGEDRKG